MFSTHYYEILNLCRKQEVHTIALHKLFTLCMRCANIKWGPDWLLLGNSVIIVNWEINNR